MANASVGPPGGVPDEKSVRGVVLVLRFERHTFMDVATLVSRAAASHRIPLVLAYIGPDVFLPLLSAGAAVLGALLVFWQRSIAIARAAWRFVFRRGQAADPGSE